MEDEPIEIEEKTSKYNSAIDQLRRIGNVWQVATTDVRSGNLRSWNIALDRIWAELAGDLAEGCPEETTFNKLNADILKVSPLKSNAAPNFNRKDIKQETISKQYELLMKKELFLRRLQNQLGKGTAYTDGQDDDMD